MSDNKTKQYLYVEEDDQTINIYDQLVSNGISSGIKRNSQKSYPLYSTISASYFAQSNGEYQKSRKYIYALKNTLNRYTFKSPHYSYSSSLGDKDKQELTLISIPSIMYGKSLKKGSVELSISYTGSLIAKASDINYNGEIIQTYPEGTSSVAGVVLYDEGFILLTGSWNNTVTNYAGQYFRWCDWGFKNDVISDADTVQNTSFNLNFNGVNEVNVLTMLAHAPKGEFNYSNNPTFIKKDQITKKNILSGSDHYIESNDIEIKNITKYPYENFSGSLEKQVYISSIGIYDEKKNLIATAKLAKPVRKTELRDFTFKLKLDI